MKKGGFSTNLKLAILHAGEQSITKFLTQSGTFKDGDLRVNKDGVRIISQSEPEVIGCGLNKILHTQSAGLYSSLRCKNDDCQCIMHYHCPLACSCIFWCSSCIY